MKKELSKSLIMNTIFLAFTLCIYAPLELYLSNHNEFWFSLSLFYWIPLFFGAIAALAAIILGYNLKGRLAILFEALLFSLGMSSYIQGNFLNLNIGVMNGADVEWAKYQSNFVINAIIWIAIFLIVFTVACKATPHFKKFSFYISTLFTLTQLVSLAALLIPYISSENPSPKASMFVSDRGLYELGEEENIVIFLLDMFDDNYFKSILETEPDIKTELDGFTYFSNFTGSYSTTVFSLAHLSTGKYFHNEAAASAWANEVSNGRIYFDELIDNDYQLNVYTNLPLCFPNRVLENVENYEYAPWEISNKLHFTYDIYQLVMCKYFPNAIKPYIWMTGNEFNYWRQYKSDYKAYNGDNDNVLFYHNLLQNEISVQGSPKQYKFIHLMGSHYPYDVDENANPVNSDDNVTGAECARGVLRIVNNYLENMKQLNCYDNTSIVIMADHGYYWDGVLSNPVFLVKPKASHGTLEINTAPTCQGDFAPTILDLTDLNADSTYGKSVFDIPEGSQRERLFYQYYLKEPMDPDNGNRRLIEYKAASETNSTEKFELTDVEYTTKGEKISHSKYCRTCQDGTLADDSYDPPRLWHKQASNYPK